MAESPYEAPDTPKLSLHSLALDSVNGDPRYDANGTVYEDRPDHSLDPASVYVFTPSQTETAAYLKQREGFMPRGGSEQPRAGSSRRQPQQRRHAAPIPNAPPPPESPQNYNAPVYVTPQYAPPHAAYGGQYTMSAQPPINMPYPPQSIHAGFPTIASYAQQYSPDTQPYASQTPQPPPTAYRYVPPISPSYSGYQQPASFASPPTMYPPHGVYQQASPYGSYPSPQHASTGPPQDAENPSGTWWFVPSPPPQQQAQQPPPPSPYESQQQNTSPAPYFYGNPVSPVQHPESSPTPLQQQYLGSPTYARASTPSSSASSPPPALPRPLVRRPYHPNPPAHRSEWVMWAGNVPSDAGHDELWRFFTATASSATSSSAASDTASTSASSEREPTQSVGTEVSGVLSIFLISRSSCAFINYDTESALEASIARFNGLPLRPADPRCARLVCRVRRRDDDLRAGVGGQRGMGLHTKYVRDKAAAAATASRGKQRASEAATDDESSESAASQLSALSLYSGDEEPTRPPLRPHTHGSASSGGGSHASGASTNSSLLVRHFPQRYFILKSLTRDDLDLSVRTGVWATQRHNEGVLDQAFRTAKDVFLIFSVNKSGEFYGYARMSRPVGQAETGSSGSRVTWAARSPPLSSPGSSPSAGRERAPPAAIASHPVPHGDSSSVHQIPQPILSAGAHLVDDSPAPLSATSPAAPGADPRRLGHANTAPAVLGRPQRGFSGVDAGPSYSLDGYARRPPPEPQIELDEAAPFRAMRNVPEGTEELGRVPEEGQAQEEGAAEGWGQNFALQWLCTERLPFTRTRHIRNPWNHDREVKVSRDGTELEPGVGQALLEEWRAYLREQQGEAATTTTTTRS